MRCTFKCSQPASTCSTRAITWAEKIEVKGGRVRIGCSCGGDLSKAHRSSVVCGVCQQTCRLVVEQKLIFLRRWRDDKADWRGSGRGWLKGATGFLLSERTSTIAATLAVASAWTFPGYYRHCQRQAHFNLNNCRSTTTAAVVEHLKLHSLTCTPHTLVLLWANKRTLDDHWWKRTDWLAGWWNVGKWMWMGSVRSHWRPSGWQSDFFSHHFSSFSGHLFSSVFCSSVCLSDFCASFVLCLPVGIPLRRTYSQYSQFSSVTSQRGNRGFSFFCQWICVHASVQTRVNFFCTCLWCCWTLSWICSHFFCDTELCLSVRVSLSIC